MEEREKEQEKIKGRKRKRKSKQVNDNVMGWTVVTRSRKQRKRTVQIFVKVDGMKTVAMEVSPEDKVQKILNTVNGSDWDVYVTCGGRTLREDDKLKSCGVRDGSTVQVTSRMRSG